MVSSLSPSSGTATATASRHPAPHPVVNATITTITDRNFFIAVFALVLSLKYHRVAARIKVLSVGLSPEQKKWLEQFEDVHVVEADPSNKRGPATRKGEAILAAEEDPSEFIALFDGDCLATGDLTPYLECPEHAIYARLKTPEEDASVFRTRYRPEDTRGTIPQRLLQQWQADVGERTTPAITNTVCGGNLVLHRECLPFIRRWQEQMIKVLPESVQGAHDFSSDAYFQVDESVLNSLLAFAADAPPARRVQLDTNPQAYLAHLGPNNPKPWKLWRPQKLKYYPMIVQFIEWAQKEGYEMPPLPWTFQRRFAPLVYTTSWAYGAWSAVKGVARKLLK